jgi:hypothetical protein
MLLVFHDREVEPSFEKGNEQFKQQTLFFLIKANINVRQISTPS